MTVTGSVDRDHPGSESRPGSGGNAGGDDGPHVLSRAELTRLCLTAGRCNRRDSGNLNPVVQGTLPGDPQGGAAATTITITDLARFLPANAALHTEPNGWAVVGVPANFWVDVSAVTVDGSLLGETAQVRFTPEAYGFAYGDGAERTVTDPGSSWAALGQQELTATHTSHVYLERADREATVTVVYSAEYRFAGGAWIAVDGAVSGRTPPQRMVVVVERTALTTPG